MLRQLLLSWAGILLGIGPLAQLLVRILLQGWSKVFSVKKRREEPAALSGFQHGYVQAEVRIHYVEKGHRTQPLMLFLHGFPDFWFSWRYQIHHFASSFWCVAIDMRGYNDSAKPEGLRQYGLHYLVADVKAVVEGLGRTQCTLVAHDWGAAVAYAFAAKWPQMLKQMVICNLPHPKALQIEQRKSWRQKIMSWYMIFFQCPKLPEIYFASSDLALLQGIVKKEMKEGQPEVEAYKYAFRDPASISAAINYYRCAFQYPEYGDAYLNVAIKVPVLSIFGTGDNYLSVSAAKASRHFVENLTEEYIEGAGHWVQVEAAEKVNKAIKVFFQQQ